MADETFDIVFRGELVPGAELAQVKQNLARLFKMDPARIELLFSGKPVVLKRGLDMDAAGKYRVAIKKAGARVDTKASAQTAAARPVQPKAAQTPSPPPEAQASTGVAQPAVARADRADDGLSLAPAGIELLAPEEKKPQPMVNIDLSSYSLKASGEALLNEDEYEQQVSLPLDLSELNLAPVGADVLKPEERVVVPTVEIDLEGLSVAPPGERLEAVKSAPPPAPDVSKLSLVNDADR